ncbi:hypothetical protein [Clostridium vincentii]|uniref:Cell division protein FtsL n=1 Tax=Clostridium vincentii TaxID=52704 RepID=A0A2T0BGH8_9CLOT|nr:hypothetical protein [Clostridium vincentii]PRR82922.1 Cell division protein FtsL [Clostridium vincentii]
MVVKEFEYEHEYVNGNTVVKPQRRSEDTDKKKYEELQRSKRERNKKRKEEKKRRHGILQITAFLFVVGMVIIVRDNNVYSMQKELTTIKSEIKVVQDDNESLRVDLLKVSSLDNIKTNAEKRLGMVPATKENTIQIELPNKYFDSIENK